MWKSAPPPPPTADQVINHGPIKLSVGPSDGQPHIMWQFFTMSFGKHSNATQEECLALWPTEAIHRARQALDQLEKELSHEN